MNDEVHAQAGQTDVAVAAYAKVWADSLSHVLAQIAGSEVEVEQVQPEPDRVPGATETDIILGIAASGQLRGEMILRLPADSALALGQLFMGEERSANAEFKADHRESLEELFRQVAGYVSTEIKGERGEVQLSLSATTVPSWSAAGSGWLQIGKVAAQPVLLEWKMSAALVAELRSATVATEAAPIETVKPAAADTFLPGNSPADNTLDLFMDVELNVTLRFGGQRMLLRQVLELGPGSVVELDRQVQEPVELLLDGRLIARGEVVVVDGNYGLRVLEVASMRAAS